MIKHSKVRLASLALLILFVVEVLVACIVPTESVENKSVNEQVCIQQESSEIEESSTLPFVGSALFKAGIINNQDAEVEVEEEDVSTTKESLEELQTIEYDNIGWTKTRVNVRALPDMNSEVYNTLSYNTQINYYIYNEEWVMIEYDSGNAFISIDYISNEKMPEIETYVYNGKKLTRSNGTVSGPTGKETYYNLSMRLVCRYMKDLGYNYSYWVRNDGCKMYGNYIMVAADTNRLPKGTIVKTTLGLGIVCDHCESAEKHSGIWLDIATTW